MRLQPAPIRFRSAYFVLLLAGALAASSACGSSGSTPSSTVTHGSGDQSENGVVSVDEAKLRGRVADGSLTVEIPVTSIADHEASGKLRVRLMSVDGTEEHAAVEVGYSLGAKEAATLSARLAAPEGIQAQSDLVEYNVVVDDGAKAGLQVTRSLMYVVPLLDLRVEGAANLRPGRESFYRVRVQNTLENAPVDGQPVTFELLENGQVVQSQDATTEVTGDAEVRMNVERPGDYQVRARMAAYGTSTELEDPVKVTGGAGKLLLTSDKPIYQPGQLINLRALSLAHDGNEPIADSPVTFEVEDGKGNKIFKKVVRTDDFGVAFSEFRLGSILNEGTFKLRAIGGDVTSEKTAQVSHYALPKFDVALTTDDPWYAPGGVVSGRVDSKYFFGKPVSGSVVVEGYSVDVGTTLFQKTMGTLSAEGRYDFSLALPASLPGLPLQQGNAAIELRVTVTDSAGQKVEKSRLVTVSAQGANVALVPESGALVPGIENELLLFATDPLGTPLANAAVHLTAPDGAALDATTDDYGQASLAWTPPSRDDAGASASPAVPGTFKAVVTLDGGKTVAATFDFSTQAGGEHLILRTDQAVYQLGDTVKVDITSTEPEGTVYVDWLNDGQTVDMRTLTAEHGHATFTTTIDGSLSGSNRIEAYLVDEQGQIVRTGRTIFARGDASLNVEVTADKEVYAPGAPAKLTLAVTDENGDPAVAALGLQIVDQAVFSLVDAKPGLLRSYFEIEDQLAKPQYELHAPRADLTSLLFQETAQKDQAARGAAQRKTTATLAAMKNTSLTGIQHGALAELLAAARQTLQPAQAALQAQLTTDVKRAVTQAVSSLEARGCRLYTGCAGSSFDVELSEQLDQSLSIYDFWGNRLRVSTSFGHVTLNGAGPDERFETTDDITLGYSFGELAIPVNAGGGPEGVGNADGAGLPSGTGGTASAGGGTSTGAQGPGTTSDGPRVRSDFPETLYVNPSVITDASGKATIDVDMADSITEWRVSALANSADGRLGGSESGIKVFQDFFVDVSFPAALTRGDAVTFPLAVYNYLDVPQTVSLELQPGDWYTALGPTTTSVTLEPGQVTGVSFPVKVDSVGLQTLTVKAIGEQKSDAVARSVRVVPDGKAFPLALSGSLDTPSVTHSVTFPAGEVPGSQQLYVDIFPAFLAQAVQGMDSILAEPNGCFEQTTSSAWPNVLVTEYMKDTKQITPAIELKAEALMSTGYQRLLTFEHAGGGFSWFGEQDPKPFLSVTAFGIMEFSDMARVHEVDSAMLARTIQWIIGQQQADGAFAGDMSEFFSFHTSVVRNTAFTAWALASAGETGDAVQRALDYVKQNLGNDNDAYTLGIVANAFATGAPSDPELPTILAALDAAKQTGDDGVHWDAGQTQTNFYGAGDDAAVSATALAAHAMLLSGAYPTSVEGALEYLTGKKDANGNFGSTQATIWTLRTLLLSARKGTKGAVGTFSVSVDGGAAQSVELTQAQSDVMTRIDLSELATAGAHDVTLEFSGSGAPSYNLVASHNLPWAAVPAEPSGPLSIDVAYDKSDLFVDEQVATTVTLQNNEDVTQNMVLVTLGVAPGFTVNTADLQKYLDSGAISRFELTGRQLILYITTLAPSAAQIFEYTMQATLPIEAVDGGAEAKLYYEPKKRTRSAAHDIKVAAR